MVYISPQPQDPNFWNVWTEPPEGSTEQEGYAEAWWVRIKTQEPEAEYYFGPFSQRCDAAMQRSGFIKELYDEGSTVMESEVLWCQPTALTVDGASK